METQTVSRQEFEFNYRTASCESCGCQEVVAVANEESNENESVFFCECQNCHNRFAVQVQ